MNDFPNEIGKTLHARAEILAKPYRSITGDGVRETLRILQKEMPLTMHEIKTGPQAFDWIVPKEWNIRDAYVLDPQGKKIIDFKKNYLHVVGYSLPVNQSITLEELDEHLYSIPEQPAAVPYVTSYYKERWGFCISDRERKSLKKGTYKVCIDSELKDGSLTFGECIIPGREEKEVLLSTYICHPQMGNDNISGISITTQLALWLQSVPRRYTYRIVFIPETIGSLVYMSQNLDVMKLQTIAGFNVTCGGDERVYSFLPSRAGDTLADRVATRVLERMHPEYIVYPFLERGGDERQYCAPGADLPVVNIMRSKYGVFPEYHTSLDDINFISPQGLYGTYEVLVKCIEEIEVNVTYQATCIGEPQLGRRGLFPTLSAKGSPSSSQLDMNNFLAYADGTRDLISISEVIGVPVSVLVPMAKTLVDAGLLRLV